MISVDDEYKYFHNSVINSNVTVALSFNDLKNYKGNWQENYFSNIKPLTFYTYNKYSTEILIANLHEKSNIDLGLNWFTSGVNSQRMIQAQSMWNVLKTKHG